MVKQTDLYTSQFISCNPNLFYDSGQNWTPMDAVELRKFLGSFFNLWPHKSIRDYWCCVYHTVMSRMCFAIMIIATAHPQRTHIVTCSIK